MKSIFFPYAPTTQQKIKPGKKWYFVDISEFAAQK